MHDARDPACRQGGKAKSLQDPHSQSWVGTYVDGGDRKWSCGPRLIRIALKVSKPCEISVPLMGN
jgi:hypothetical protein